VFYWLVLFTSTFASSMALNMTNHLPKILRLMPFLMICIAAGLMPGSAEQTPQQAPKEIKLEQTFYYHGNVNPNNSFAASIDVDADGTVAVGVTPTIGEFNVSQQQLGTALLFNPAGEPVGRIESPASVMQAVVFGPDHRIYTAEGWFGAGAHVYDRAAASPRAVPVRHLNADGSHVDKGFPTSVAVGPDYRIYTLRQGKLFITSPENKLLKEIVCPGNTKLNVDSRGVVYAGNRLLQADGTWKELPYTVRDVAPDGKLLVVFPKGKWAIYDPQRNEVERQVRLPDGQWHDVALGPDSNLYLVPTADPGLAYVVADSNGKVLLRRGADFDRLRVSLPGGVWISGTEVAIQAEISRSRNLGYVPKSVELPQDNRMPLKLEVFLAPMLIDPLGGPAWEPCPFSEGPGGKVKLKLPGGLHGPYRFRIGAGNLGGGRHLLEAETEMILRPAGAAAYLTPATDRNRTAFVAGMPVRITVAAEALANVDLSAVRLVLQQEEKTLCEAPLRLPKLAGGERATAVVVLPGELTGMLRPGSYTVSCAGLPQGVGSGSALVAIVDPVRRSDFETLFHVLVGGVGPDTTAAAKLHAELGASHVINAPFGGSSAGGNTEEALDVYARLGVSYSAQLYFHFAALNCLPQEQGAVRQWLAETAQRLAPYPAFRGFNYHDLNAHAGMESDVPRKDFYPALWAELGAKMPVPETLPPDKRGLYREGAGRSLLLPQLYRQWGEAIRHAVPRLERTTMQWWHSQGLDVADPDKVAADQDVISTQHMEEQFYHPITVANQVDLWRRPNLPLYCYGNASFHQNGTGAVLGREMMAGLSRGVQGIGRNELPQPGKLWTELLKRPIAPVFQLLERFGGLSAAGEPEDEVAVWRSFVQEAVEDPKNAYSLTRHHLLMAGAYATCMYAHRPAAIITDERIRAGELKKYKAMIISCAVPPPADLAAKIAEFQKGGGLVLANHLEKTFWIPPGAKDLGPLFAKSHAAHAFNQDLRRWFDMQADEGGTLARKLREVLGARVQPLADCDDSGIWLSSLRTGKGHAVFVTNLKLMPHRPTDLERYSAYESEVLPTRVTIRLRPGPYIVYDVFNGKRLSPREQNGKWLVDVDLTVFPGAILALAPAALEDLDVRAGQSDSGTRLEMEVIARDARKDTLDTAVPLEVTITGADGQECYHFFRTARHGQWRETLPVASNDRAGSWTIAVRELLDGRRWTSSLTVRSPSLPAITQTPPVEWFGEERLKTALAKAKTVALVVGDKAQTRLAAAVMPVKTFLTDKGKQVVEIKAGDYRADRARFGWDKFQLATFNAAVRPRPARYDLIVTFDTPDMPSGVIPWKSAPVPLSATDPGPSRGLVQFVAMPIYDTEDAVALAGGDLTGLRLAAEAFIAPPAPLAEPAAPAIRIAPLPRTADSSPGPTLRQFFGVPVAELAATGDGKRIAVAMQGWGNNLFVLDGDGKVLAKDMAGSWMPVHLRALEEGFAVLTHANDPTVLYLKLYDREGKSLARLAAPGRRIGATSTSSIGHPTGRSIAQAQASFSVTPDMHYAAVAGSKAIAIWDLRQKSVVWRDDTIHYPDYPVNDFPQVMLSADANTLAVRANGRLTIRSKDGSIQRQQDLPKDTLPGRVRVQDGHRVVLGDTDLLGYLDGVLQWRWKATGEVSATAFAADALHFAVGEPDGTLRLFRGGGQAGAYLAPSGGILGLDMTPDGKCAAFATSTGWVGVIDETAKVLWQHSVGSRAAIAFVGVGGDTVVGDGRGFVHRFNSAGRELWAVDLTPLVFRDDLASVLKAGDKTPTLRLPPPKTQRVMPRNRPNLASLAEVKFVPAKTGAAIVPLESGHDDVRYLINGKTDDRTTPWFTPLDLYEIMGFADYQNPVAIELRWKQPVKLDTLVVYEHSKHPEAVPEDVSIEVWVGDDKTGKWEEVVHDLWNQGVIHVHPFPAVTTTRLRYRIHGDLGNNLWTTEIAVFGKDGK
jgi:hypothetical protein